MSGLDTIWAARPAPSGEMTPEVCRLARLSLGWTPERLAVAAGLAPQTIRGFEAATCQPRPGTLIALRKALRSAGAFGPGNAEPSS